MEQQITSQTQLPKLHLNTSQQRPTLSKQKVVLIPCIQDKKCHLVTFGQLEESEGATKVPSKLANTTGQQIPTRAPPPPPPRGPHPMFSFSLGESQVNKEPERYKKHPHGCTCYKRNAEHYFVNLYPHTVIEVILQ